MNTNNNPKGKSSQKQVVIGDHHNHLKLAISLLDNERTDLVKNLNVGLQNSKLLQDEQIQNDILELHRERSSAYENLRKCRKQLFDTNRAIVLWQRKDSKVKTKLEKNEFKKHRKHNIFGEVEEILFKKSNYYNNGVKKQKELRYELDSILKELKQKSKLYDAIITQLNNEGKILVNVGENALKAQKERENAMDDLQNLKDANQNERKKREFKIYTTKYRLKHDLELSDFLQQKHVIRLNRTKDECDEANIIERRLKCGTFLKFLIHSTDETDLEVVTRHIRRMGYDKDSLFHLLLFFEREFSKVESRINAIQEVAIDKHKSNMSSEKMNDCKIKEYLETIESNDQTIKEDQEFTDNLKSLYDELIDRIYIIFQSFKVNQSIINYLDIHGRPNERNFVSYVTEIENKSKELLYKVNCIENSCITGQNDDPLTSDADSKENLITKDLDGIEIKMHRFLNMKDPYMLSIPTSNLDTGHIPSPCLDCVEARLVEEGNCNVFSTCELDSKKEDLGKRLGIECDRLISLIDFNNIHPKLAAVLHDKSNCKLAPKLNALK